MTRRCTACNDFSPMSSSIFFQGTVYCSKDCLFMCRHCYQDSRLKKSVLLHKWRFCDAECKGMWLNKKKERGYLKIKSYVATQILWVNTLSSQIATTQRQLEDYNARIVRNEEKMEELLNLE